MTELKPCPFCGSDNIAIRGDNGVYILCNVCHVELHDHQETNRHIEMWNRRVEE